MKRYIHDLPCWKPIKSTMCGRGRGEGCTIDDLITLQRIRCRVYKHSSFTILPESQTTGWKTIWPNMRRTIWGGKWRKNWSSLMSPNSNHPRLHCALQTFHYLINCFQRFHKQQTKTQKYTFPHIMNNNFYPTYVWV